MHLAGVTAVLTALMGLFLAQEGGYETNSLSQHQWFGVAVSFLTYGLLIVDNHFSDKRNIWLVALYGNVGLVILAGHLGGSLTHGEGFVFAPMKSETISQSMKMRLFIKLLLSLF